MPLQSTVVLKAGSTALTPTLTGGSDVTYSEGTRANSKRQFFVFTDAQAARRRLSLDVRPATASVNKTTGATKWGKNSIYMVIQDFITGTNAVSELATMNVTLDLPVGMTDAAIKDLIFRGVQALVSSGAIDTIITQNNG